MLCADGSNLHALITLRNCSLKWNDRLTCSCRPRSCFLKVPSMSLHPDFIQILSRFLRNSLNPDFILIFEKIWVEFEYSIFSNFIQVLFWFHFNFILIFQNSPLSKFYPYFIRILSGWNMDKLRIKGHGRA